ncbi:hypothetical protein ACPW96_00045 [Micromonospora sp. DT81.3]|uniref:hypothetical protein n=1 Tax=Micromonospora sp. DT81.3 TaxID=3416523 RepID=UPI003CF83613
MPQQVTGLLEVLNDAGQVVVTIDPNEPAAITISTPDGKTQVTGGGYVTDGTVTAERDLVLGSPSFGARPSSFKVVAAGGGTILNFDGQFAVLDIGGAGNEGDLRVRDNDNRVRLHIDSGRGSLFMTDASGNLVFRFDSDHANLDVGNVLGGGGAGDVRVHDAAGNVRIHLDGASGNVITSGADCAEDFSIDPSEQLGPGTVVSLDEDELLRASMHPYDRRVAGILSGANGVSPGVILGREAGVPNRLPLALAGKAWCKVDASYGAIGVGDLLTTSATPGHAMNATDSSRAYGAVIGKALRPWRDGLGLVPVLVAFG